MQLMHVLLCGAVPRNARLPKEWTMFKIGDEVNYGIHGRLQILAIETKQIGAEEHKFYLMKPVLPPAIAKTAAKAQASILVPVKLAEANGLRGPMTDEQATTALTVLADREYYWELNEPWLKKQRTLEDAIRRQGTVGLAKAVGHLHVLVKRDAAPRSDMVKFYEAQKRGLVREISEAQSVASKDIELLVEKALRNKLHADN